MTVLEKYGSKDIVLAFKRCWSYNKSRLSATAITTTKHVVSFTVRETHMTGSSRWRVVN